MIIKNNIYQYIPKEPQVQKIKIWTIPLLLESPKPKQLQTPDLEKPTEFGAASKLSIFPLGMK